MKIQYEVMVNETGETRTFDSREACSEWIEKVKNTLLIWGSIPTFKTIRKTEEEICL